MKKYAYCTVLSEKSYVPGLIGLYYSVLENGGEHDFVCLIPKDIDVGELKDLENRGLIFLRVEPVLIPNIDEVNGKDNPWTNTFLKLRMFELVQYQKVIYFDLDIIVKKEISHLFSKPYMSAVPDGEQFTGLREGNSGLNSGMIIFVPNKKVTEQLLESIIPAIQYRASVGKTVGDQDVINFLFSNWDNENLAVSEIYNTSVPMFDKMNRKKRNGFRFNDVVVLHFVGKSKPWNEKKHISIVRYLLKGKIGAAKSIYLFWHYYNKRGN